MRKILLGGTAALVLGFGAIQATAQDAPFGTDTEVAYAKLLWDLMVDSKLAGDGAIHTFPYEGVAPHGMMLETFYTEATLGGHTGKQTG